MRSGIGSFDQKKKIDVFVNHEKNIWTVYEFDKAELSGAWTVLDAMTKKSVD